MYDPNLHQLAQAQTREQLAAAAEARERKLTWERGPGLGDRLAALGRQLIALGQFFRPQWMPHHRQKERHRNAWERP